MVPHQHGLTIPLIARGSWKFIGALHHFSHEFQRRYNLVVPKKEKPAAESLDAFNQRVVGCQRCPRLRSYCQQIGETKRRAYLHWEYWARPVPSFGDPAARVLIVGLAPGAHGSNRTGRPFTGDGSGEFLYPVLHKVGFASQPTAHSREDDLKLHDLWITAVVRCAPPDNKPLPEELQNCAPHLDEEIALLGQVRVVVCLGRIAFDAYTAHLVRTGRMESRRGLRFAHGAEYAIPGDAIPRGIHLLATYHPSLQNTNTGRLTKAMFLRIFRRAKELAEK